MLYLFLLALLAPAVFGERWTLQYFYDDLKDKLEILDLAFPSAQHGVAIGWTGDISSDRKVKAAVLLTTDGGQHWKLDHPFLEDEPRSLFFLNDNQGWMVTENAIWTTSDGGAKWRRLCDQAKPNPKLKPAPPGGLILRVWFLDAEHGFAIGYQKTVLETRDGGKTWKPLAEAAKPTGDPTYTAYSTMAFDGDRGLIVGTAIPPRRELGPFPSWMDPTRATKTVAAPNVTLLLETRNGGVDWNSSTSSLLGSVSAIRLAGQVGLSLLSYPESLEYPSEVFDLDLSTGTSKSSFKDKNRRVYDAALFRGPAAVLAAVEPTGRLNSVPIPGKVKMLSSVDLVEWKEMDVDYRAVATSLVLAGPDRQHLWVATDTGMILHLAP